ncbi:MAG: hypothetical protein LBM25_02415 [Bacteroidales bacterium]|jgi:hypothetical protein|nr:hypothetical protein [Bacteroidales bacterium]
MSRLKYKLKNFSGELKHKHRLIVMDADTYTEKFTLTLSGRNLFVGIGISIILLICLTTIIIAFTPLREYIPGYTNESMQEQTYKNASAIDSLTNVISQQEQLINNIKMVVLGKDDAASTLLNSNIKEENPSKQESIIIE